MGETASPPLGREHDERKGTSPTTHAPSQPVGNVVSVGRLVCRRPQVCVCAWAKGIATPSQEISRPRFPGSSTQAQQARSPGRGVLSCTPMYPLVIYSAHPA